MPHTRLKHCIVFSAGTVCLALATAVAAADAVVPGSCHSTAFTGKQLTLELATLTGAAGKRLYFQQDTAGCPADAARCQSADYVTAGDRVLINQLAGKWACAWHQDEGQGKGKDKGQGKASVGWLRSNDLVVQVAAPGAAPVQWVGEWRGLPDGGHISIERNGASLYVSGSAHTGGKRGPAATTPASSVVAGGELDGELQAEQAKGRLINGTGATACMAEFSRLGDYLVVSDNGQCGGATQARYGGVYRRK